MTSGKPTPRQVNAAYGRRWIISPGMGGGWYAVRRSSLSDQSLKRGLSNVRGGATLEELARHLAEETRLEERQWRPGPG